MMAAASELLQGTGLETRATGSASLFLVGRRAPLLGAAATLLLLLPLLISTLDDVRADLKQPLDYQLLQFELQGKQLVPRASLEYTTLPTTRSILGSPTGM